MGTCSCQLRMGYEGSSTYLCKTRQIDQGQAQNMRRVDLEVDRLSIDAFVITRYPSRLCFDLALDLGEVVEPPSGLVEELAPFLLSCDAGRGVRNVDFVVCGLVFAVAWEVDELQDEWPPCNDATSTRQEVPADDVLQNRGLSG